MSYASSRNPVVRGFSSVNINSLIQLASANTPLVSGVLTPLVEIDYPDGIYSGWAQIQVVGDATTDFTYLNIVEDNENANTNERQSYFVNTTLPDTSIFYIKYPITRANFSDNNNEVVLSAQAVFVGTAPSIHVTYLYLVKIG